MRERERERARGREGGREGAQEGEREEQREREREREREMHVHVYIYIYVHECIYIYADIHACIHTCIQTYILAPASQHQRGVRASSLLILLYYPYIISILLPSKACYLIPYCCLPSDSRHVSSHHACELFFPFLSHSPQGPSPHTPKGGQLNHAYEWRFKE